MISRMFGSATLVLLTFCSFVFKMAIPSHNNAVATTPSTSKAYGVPMILFICIKKKFPRQSRIFLIIDFNYSVFKVYQKLYGQNSVN